MRAEVVEPVVERDGDAGAGVDAGFEPERAAALGRRGQAGLRAEDGAQGRGRAREDGHHGVAQRLHQRAALGGDRLAQHVEVVHHRAEGHGVADLAVHPRRVAQVGEEDGHVADVDLVAGPQCLRGEEVAEELEGRDLGGRRRLVAPRRAFEDEEALARSRVLEGEEGGGRDARLGLRPAFGAGAQRQRGRTIGRHGERLRALDAVRPQAVAALFERRAELAPLARREELLGDDVRRDLRAADAELAQLQPADGRVGAEDDLDRAVELHREIYLARVAVDFGAHAAEALGRPLRAAAVRADHLPAQVEETGARGLEAEFEGVAARRPPRGRERVGAEASERQLVAELDGLDEARGVGGALFAQAAFEHGEELALGVAERGRAGGVRLLGAQRQLVVAAEGRGELAGREASDLEGDGGAPERAARPRPDFVDEARAAALALVQLGDDAHLGDRAAAVSADDAEAPRPHPLEGLLLPLDADAELREAEPAARVRPGGRGFGAAAAVERGHARVAVEAVGVGDERPEGLRAGAQVELPTVVELFLLHESEPGAGEWKRPAARGGRQPRSHIRQSLLRTAAHILLHSHERVNVSVPRAVDNYARAGRGGFAGGRRARRGAASRSLDGRRE